MPENMGQINYKLQFLLIIFSINNIYVSYIYTVYAMRTSNL